MKDASFFSYDANNCCFSDKKFKNKSSFVEHTKFIGIRCKLQHIWKSSHFSSFNVVIWIWNVQYLAKYLGLWCYSSLVERIKISVKLIFSISISSGEPMCFTDLSLEHRCHFCSLNRARSKLNCCVRYCRH